MICVIPLVISAIYLYECYHSYCILTMFTKLATIFIFSRTVIHIFPICSLHNFQAQKYNLNLLRYKVQEKIHNIVRVVV